MGLPLEQARIYPDIGELSVAFGSSFSYLG